MRNSKKRCLKTEIQEGKPKLKENDWVKIKGMPQKNRKWQIKKIQQGS
jgi:hypothetical protein